MPLSRNRIYAPTAVYSIQLSFASALRFRLLPNPIGAHELKFRNVVWNSHANIFCGSRKAQTKTYKGFSRKRAVPSVFTRYQKHVCAEQKRIYLFIRQNIIKSLATIKTTRIIIFLKTLIRCLRYLCYAHEMQLILRKIKIEGPAECSLKNH